MSRVEWNTPGSRIFEAGVDQGVLYPKVGPGVPWNGLVSVNEESSGGDLESLYFNGLKYLDLIGSEDFQATVEAYSAPAEFAASDGMRALSPGLFVTQQPRATFGICYRTLLGNDLVRENLGYKLHIVYNCLAAPSGQSNQTLTATIAPPTKSWAVSTVPPASSTFRPTAHIVIDSTQIDADILEALEIILYGRDAVGTLTALAPRLPTVAEIVQLFDNKITPLIEPLI